MKTYYETPHRDGNEYAAVIAHDTLDDAIEYADANGIAIIYEIGSAWDEFEKCAFCGEWFPSTDLNSAGDCARCAQAIKDHGGI